MPEADRRSPSFKPVLAYPAELPVSARREEILAALRDSATLILAGETGSGKTTQLPKMLVESGFAESGLIAVTQPRRVAATAVSRRIAEEMRAEWGGYVGCSIRFTDKSSPATRVRVMTDGILLNEIQRDPLLRQYSAVMLDEAHERSLNMDFLLGHFRKIRDARPDLRLVVTSATLDLEAFSAAFPGAPVIQVSGRTFPVEVIWRPLDLIREEAGEISHVEASVQTTRDIAATGDRGDILIFMPTERDIRETCSLLAKNGPKPADILPLFGRLSSEEQQRIFAPSQRRKIVVATNVAETSLTIPGIRFVIDTGLARVSRHSPQTRTQRLPVEPVSQSAANQRKGRCGRVADGVCFRLYSESDYERRPAQTEPEILRSNLAGVILRMLAFNLGDIRTFPFVNAPAPRAIDAGFAQLHELGAIDDTHRLLPLGREMARLPVDPTFARILLRARDERCLREALVIAAGLSIMDPRERPRENPGQADAMHRPFLHPESDFLTLLNIWDAYHDECENLSQAKLRRFCREHFLNYMRMQEWRDLHSQLARAIRDGDEPAGSREAAMPVDEARYAAIHRAILSGLLGNIAKAGKEGLYDATHGRKAALFPGSGAAKARRGAEVSRLRRKSGDPAPPAAPKMPAWIVCAGWMETTRLFARTVARISPAWIVDLGKHLLVTTLKEPFWDEANLRASIRERVRMHGLEIASNAVALARTDPAAATEMFIRNALVPDLVPEPLAFLEHNRATLARVEDRLMRLRKFSAGAIDEKLFDFYATRLESVGAVGDLRRFVREHEATEPRLLFLEERDLAPAEESDAAAFPSSVTIGGREFPLVYRQSPGGADDGVTLKLPAELYASLPAGFLDWLVPGYLPERIETMLRRAPKEARIALHPIGERVEELLRDLKPDPRRTLAEWLSSVVRERRGVVVFSKDLEAAEVPSRLVPRLELEDASGRSAGAARDLGSLRDIWREAVEKVSPPAPVKSASARAAPSAGADVFAALRAKHEITGLTGWTFPDMPESIPAGDAAGAPIFAWPGLQAANGGAHLRIFRSRDEAREATLPGLIALAEIALKPEFAALDYALSKDLKSLHLHWFSLGSGDSLFAGSKSILRRHALAGGTPLPLTKIFWESRLRDARDRLKGLADAYVKSLKGLLEARDKLLSGDRAYPDAAADIATLFPKDFLLAREYADFPRYARWLRGRSIRRDRRIAASAKDEEKIVKFQPCANAAETFSRLKPGSFDQREVLEDFFRFAEEYRLSIFAPEIVPEIRVSPALLAERIAGVKRLFGMK